MNKLVTLLCIVLSLSACSKGGKPAEKPNSPWEAQIETLEQAKQLDQKVEDSAEKQREELEKQGL